MLELQQIKSICEEIKHLQGKWASGDLSQRDLRAESTILRRLLIYGELQQVWFCLMGKIPFYLDGNKIEIVDETRLKTIDLYTCSDVTLPGQSVSHVSVKLGDLNEEYCVKTVQERFKLKNYELSTCIIAEGIPINRSMVIQYVANSLGGSHWGKSKKGPDFDLAMKKLSKFDITDYPACLTELAAIGQAICKSECTDQLMAEYENWLIKNPNVRIS